MATIRRNGSGFGPARPPSSGLDPERARVRENDVGAAPWYRWGPYLAERQWGTVREDYSAHGEAWDSFPHDHARSRAYRWGEDGLLGISDNHGRLCFALALWNEADPILKERLFGLTGPEGNHGEDVKECYYYLDATPSHSYLKALYKYPQRAFPYADLVQESPRRGRGAPEYELLDTGIFAEQRYFDVLVEYAKAAPEDIAIRITITNRGPAAAPVHLLPTLWFRNTWSWGRDPRRPQLREMPHPEPGVRHGGDSQAASQSSVTQPETAGPEPISWVQAEHPLVDGPCWWGCAGGAELLFTENETNAERLWGMANATPYVKDSINDYVVHGKRQAVNPERRGTKVAAHYRATLEAGEARSFYLRLTKTPEGVALASIDALIEQRRQEADQFYARLARMPLSEDQQNIQRQGFAGLIWSKQFYYYNVEEWLAGDPGQPSPPDGRDGPWGRNVAWPHLYNADVLSMPDTWEYPWYAAWDLAFHCIPFALIDASFAKRQLILLLREWYMHPNGQLPAYEWAFSDVNPPVHAWAALRVFRIDQRINGRPDYEFLERVFHKLLLNFTWWVNRKDPEGNNVFGGGFLGLDNIGVFDRSAALPTGGSIEQADGTAWMGMYCLNMLAIALELAVHDHSYEDVATKFFEHFMFIAGALNNIHGDGIALWDDEDEFCYDVLRLPDGHAERMRVRSLVGLIPLLAVETMEPEQVNALPNFRRRMEWFLTHKPKLASLVSRWTEPGAGERRLLALMRGHRMKRLLARMLDPNEFLSEYGVRSLSRIHRDQPYTLHVNGMSFTIAYEPAESHTGLFGGNSNWRGPVWFPINYLLIEAVQKFHYYYGDEFLIEHPTGSGNRHTLWEIAADLSARLIALFERDSHGRRPAHGDNPLYAHDPHWRDLILFYEYFHGDSGAGLGASHQTGWTALVAKLIDQVGIE